MQISIFEKVRVSAEVRVYRGSSLIAVFSVPSDKIGTV